MEWPKLKTLEQPSQIDAVALLSQWSLSFNHASLLSDIRALCGYEISSEDLEESIREYIDVINMYEPKRSANTLTYILLTKIIDTDNPTKDTVLIKKSIEQAVLRSFIAFHRNINILKVDSLDIYISKIDDVYDAAEVNLVNDLLYNRELYHDNNAVGFKLLLDINSKFYNTTYRGIVGLDRDFIDVELHMMPFGYIKSSTDETMLVLIDLAEDNIYVMAIFAYKDLTYTPDKVYGEYDVVRTPVNIVDISKAKVYKVIYADSQDLVYEYNKFVKGLFDKFMTFPTS